MAPRAMLETALYAHDLDAAVRFYGDTLGLALVRREGDRHAFFRVGDAMLLIFNPDETDKPPAEGALPVPPHGARGPGHACFAATAGEIADWERRLPAAGVPIEAAFDWPQGGRSIYVRDPAGNSVEFAEPRIWGF